MPRRDEQTPIRAEHSPGCKGYKRGSLKFCCMAIAAAFTVWERRYNAPFLAACAQADGDARAVTEDGEFPAKIRGTPRHDPTLNAAVPNGSRPAESRHDALQHIARALLAIIDPDPARAGIADTPRRFAALWEEFIDREPGTIDTAFDTAGDGQMVVVSGMRVWSFCEHHLLPFYVDVAIGYVPAGKILGLSKFARIAHHIASRLQVQERVIAEIAAEVKRVTDSEHVAVVGQGEHLCMTMRGARTPALMTTEDLSGDFRHVFGLRDAFYRHAGLNGGGTRR